MGNEKPISLEVFKDNLKSYYSDSGELNLDIDNRVETFTKAAINQYYAMNQNISNDENALFLSELLISIKKRDIKLDELVSSNRTSKYTGIN